MGDKGTKPAEQYRQMFPAQVIRDASMANLINRLMERKENKDDNYLIICGMGHMAYGHGVPERIWKPDIHRMNDSYLIVARDNDSSFKNQEQPTMTEIFGTSQEGCGQLPPADLLIVTSVPGGTAAEEGKTSNAANQKEF